MKTALFTSSYFDGFDLQQNDRLQRNIRYVDYYSSIKNELGINKIILFDNGSKRKYVNPPDILKIIENEHVEHDPKRPFHYPNCWRSLYHVQELIKEGYEKIIMIDTDGFVLSKRLAHYIKNLKSDWLTFWCRRYNFPSAEIAILSKEAFPTYLKFVEIPWQKRLGDLMERSIPYTKIEHNFLVDRFGEFTQILPENIDFHGQSGPNFKPILL